MKPYQALPVILIIAGACSDASEPIIRVKGKDIEFGVTELSAVSRACSFEPDTLTLHSNSDTCSVSVGVTVTDMSTERLLSRAIPVTGTDAITAFSVYSFCYSSATAVPKPFFAAEKAVRQGDTWITPTTYYWPDTPDTTLDFWAMAGTDAPGVTVTASQTGIGAMSIDYTVPQQAAPQADLIIATTERMNTPGVSVPLRFRHICSAVKFVIGNEIQPGTIKEITVSGIMSRGRYTTQWNDLSGESSFTISANKATTDNEKDGDPIVPDYNTLMMIPQQLSDNAMLTVVFHDNVTGTDRNLTASLAGNTWRQGTVTTYRIGITPEYKLEFTGPVATQDAHYVICNSTIHVDGLPADKTWRLTAEASDGADVSVQLTADVNEFVKQGFWTDKEIINSQTVTSISARGTATVSGNGSGVFPLTVFLPENISDADRTITLTLNVNGAPSRYAVTQQFKQVPPLWNGDTGWEQIDDNITGAYGFMYTARHVYVYNYWSLNYIINDVEKSVKQLIEQYNASNYVEYGRYKRNAISAYYRFYVAIDYSKLSNLNDKASSPVAGLDNTKQMFSFGGSAVSNTFRDALFQLKKIQDGSKAFREREKPGTTQNQDPEDVPAWIEGTEIKESQALTYVLKKNRYYLNRYKDTQSGLETTAPIIKEENIKWYLPAYRQFDGMPAGSFATGEFWSSTAYSDATQAYTGNGTLSERTAKLKIRVARNR